MTGITKRVSKNRGKTVIITESPFKQELEKNKYVSTPKQVSKLNKYKIQKTAKT